MKYSLPMIQRWRIVDVADIRAIFVGEGRTSILWARVSESSFSFQQIKLVCFSGRLPDVPAEPISAHLPGACWWSVQTDGTSRNQLSMHKRVHTSGHFVVEAAGPFWNYTSPLLRRHEVVLWRASIHGMTNISLGRWQEKAGVDGNKGTARLLGFWTQSGLSISKSLKSGNPEFEIHTHMHTRHRLWNLLAAESQSEIGVR